MVQLSGHVICKNEQESDLIAKYLPEHIRQSRAEPGCLSFEVQQTENPLIWSVEEAFTDQTAFDAHQTRTKASPWFAATGHIRREYRIIS
jgi:quinol monooxygenase YgiN